MYINKLTRKKQQPIIEKWDKMIDDDESYKNMENNLICRPCKTVWFQNIAWVSATVSTKEA